MADLDKALDSVKALLDMSHNGATVTDPRTYHAAVALGEIAGSLKEIAARLDDVSRERR